MEYSDMIWIEGPSVDCVAAETNIQVRLYQRVSSMYNHCTS
jgi:hypothetical protein